jgi:hypothetical protein
MNKFFKIGLNILIFALIAGFGYYVVHSMMTEEQTFLSGNENRDTTFVSPYRVTNSFRTVSEIICFDIYENTVIAVLSDRISVFDLSGNHQRDFEIETDVRDITVEESAIYLLYPTRINVYSFDGQQTGGWEASGLNSDYCSITTTKNYVFVTDASNKEIVQYDKEGQLVRFIRSPNGFIIPSYSFDIININDTIYCSNSGRHQIESYTIYGELITSFGESGAQAGAFIGCCNPVYLEKSSNGHILTSEKGIPRISCYGRNGKFRTVLFDAHSLGGGTVAYQMRVSGEYIYIANRRTISAYRFDPAFSEKSCEGCEVECPLRQGVNN